MSEYIVDLAGTATKTAKELAAAEAFLALSGLPVLEGITRCKDCAMWSNEPQHPYEESQWCGRYGTRMGPYDFCSMARRRDE